MLAATDPVIVGLAKNSDVGRKPILEDALREAPLEYPANAEYGNILVLADRGSRPNRT